MTLRILVAGATGYLGRFVVAELAARGHEVRVLVRDPDRLGEPGPAGAPVISNRVASVHIGDVTQPDSLQGIGEGVDAVFSSVSAMSAARRGKTWDDVDRRGNLALLQEAERAGVRAFTYVSVFNAQALGGIPIVDAHEAVAHALSASHLEATVVRPTGYFSDLGVMVSLALRGVIPMLDGGSNLINPIHGADLAILCADTLARPQGHVDVGGPEVLSFRAIAELAFQATGRAPRFVDVPAWVPRLVMRLLRPVAPYKADLARFFVESAALDHVAPRHGTRTIGPYFDAMVQSHDN